MLFYCKCRRLHAFNKTNVNGNGNGNGNGNEKVNGKCSYHPQTIGFLTQKNKMLVLI